MASFYFRSDLTKNGLVMRSYLSVVDAIDYLDLDFLLKHGFTSVALLEISYISLPSDHIRRKDIFYFFKIFCHYADIEFVISNEGREFHIYEDDRKRLFEDFYLKKKVSLLDFL